MRPYNMLSVRCFAGVATIIGDGENVISVIGASMSNVTRSDSGEFLDQISVELGSEKVGIIAVNVLDPKSRNNHCFLINVVKEGEKIDVSIKSEHCFIPLPGRMAQIYPDGRIEVIIDESIYVTSFPRVFSGNKAWHLVDADNLCRYISGLLNKDELEAVSNEKMETLAQEKKIRNLEEDLLVLSDENQELKNQNEELLQMNIQLVEETKNLDEEKKRLEKGIKKINDAAEGLSTDFVVAKTKWFQGKEFKRMLQDFFKKLNEK